MTIGQQGDLQAFTKMNQIKETLCKQYSLSPEEV
jgi:hypothetical protein